MLLDFDEGLPFELLIDKGCRPCDFSLEVACLTEAASIFPFLVFPVLSIARYSNNAILETMG